MSVSTPILIAGSRNCCAPAASGHAATLPIVWMKSRHLKEPSLSLKDHVLWPSIQVSKQESAPNETGERCDNVRRTNPERSMTAWGVRRDKAALSSGCKSHPATLQPEAAGA